MTLNDDELKRIFRSYVSKRDRGSRHNCPSLDELARFFEPGPRRKKKLEIIDHVTNCSACAEEFEFIRELHHREAKISEEVIRITTDQGANSIDPNGGSKQSPIWRFAPVTAGVLLTIASLIIMVKGNRFDEARSVSSSLVLLSPGPSQSGTSNLVFEWKPVRGADSYVLEIFDEVLLPIWKSPGGSGTVLSPPNNVLDRLRKEGLIFWMVTAFNAERKITESELRQLRLGSRLP